jgi:hypothetical protein
MHFVASMLIRSGAVQGGGTPSFLPQLYSKLSGFVNEFSGFMKSPGSATLLGEVVRCPSPPLSQVTLFRTGHVSCFFFHVKHAR